jgi:hypothetical protein
VLSATPTSFTVAAVIADVDSAGWTIGAIAILTALVIAWREFGVKEDLKRLRRRVRRRGPSDGPR